MDAEVFFLLLFNLNYVMQRIEIIMGTNMLIVQSFSFRYLIT